MQIDVEMTVNHRLTCVALESDISNFAILLAALNDSSDHDSNASFDGGVWPFCVDGGVRRLTTAMPW